MHGMFPPGKNDYLLKESQKANAIPPVYNFDFKEWIDEMGSESLPYQATIFPIQMEGEDDDYMLNINDNNCKYRAENRKES